MNRLKNGIILMILISFLCFVIVMPVSCLFETLTGISCPACGMTRAFLAMLRFDFLSAIYYNILSIPLAIFLAYAIIRLIIDFIQNHSTFLEGVLKFLQKYYLIILLLLGISFLFNNLK